GSAQLLTGSVETIRIHMRDGIGPVGNKHMGTSKNPNFVTTLCYSQKMFPYISVICCVTIFCSRPVLFGTLNF
ncbi:hypothetical protein, partial [Nitrosomonas sp.]|uniref:hypothetical protein n=1 Tax=Nitrosomonas sp. TaxID=42353 RepID=UPI00272EEBBD